MKRKQGLSPAEIIQIAKSNGVFSVLKYHYRHDNLRKKCRRLVREGRLRFAGQMHKKLLYVPHEPNPCKAAGGHLDPVHFHSKEIRGLWLCLECENQIAGSAELSFDDLGVLVDFAKYLRDEHARKKVTKE